MCLIIGAPRDRSRKSAYKVLRAESDSYYYTPVANFRVTNEVLVAEGEYNLSKGHVSEGVIHVFTDLEGAKAEAQFYKEFDKLKRFMIFEVEVDPKDWVADGIMAATTKSAAYTKIKIGSKLLTI